MSVHWAVYVKLLKIIAIVPVIIGQLIASDNKKVAIKKWHKKITINKWHQKIAIKKRSPIKASVFWIKLGPLR
ncbi:hypothetical protein DLE54_01535 [Psychrobacter sp. YP14]|nr:hypothetical protein DLE54_01535 [Psychrobacter sp. YP14]